MGASIIVASAYSQSSTKHIEYSSIEELCEKDENITDFSPYVPATKLVKASKEEKAVPIDGVSSKYLSLRSRKIDFGRNIDPLTGGRKEKNHKHAYRTEGNIIQPFIKIVEERYNRLLPMVVSTNLDGAAMKDRYGVRTSDRIKELATAIKYNGNSYRNNQSN